MLALKQNGMRLPEKISLDGLWGTWMWEGKKKEKKSRATRLKKYG